MSVYLREKTSTTIMHYVPSASSSPAEVLKMPIILDETIQRCIELLNCHQKTEIFIFSFGANPNQDILDNRMKRIRFRVAASPFAATSMALYQTAKDLADKFPKASQAVLTSFYINDCLTGADSIQEALVLQQQLQDLLKMGGLPLRKWRTNSNGS